MGEGRVVVTRVVVMVKADAWHGMEICSDLDVSQVSGVMKNTTFD